MIVTVGFDIRIFLFSSDVNSSLFPDSVTALLFSVTDGGTSPFLWQEHGSGQGSGQLPG